MAAIGLWVNAYHVGHIRALNVCPIQHLLTDIVKLIGEDAPLYSEGIVGLFSDKAIGHFGEPPDA